MATKCIATKKNGEKCTYNVQVGKEYCGKHIDNVECVVCFENVKKNDRVCLTCNHTFHKICIRKWMKENPSCPVCRKNIPVDPEDHEIVNALEMKRKLIEQQQIDDDHALAELIQYAEDNEEVYLEPNRFLLNVINSLEDEFLGYLFRDVRFIVSRIPPPNNNQNPPPPPNNQNPPPPSNNNQNPPPVIR